MAVEDLRAMVGKQLLVGVTYVNAEDEVVNQLQFAGIVLDVEPLVSIQRGAGEPFTLPPEPAAFDHAQPGEYQLRSTGETVVDPDYVTTWTVQAPPQSRGRA